MVVPLCWHTNRMLNSLTNMISEGYVYFTGQFSIRLVGSRAVYSCSYVVFNQSNSLYVMLIRHEGMTTMTDKNI